MREVLDTIENAPLPDRSDESVSLDQARQTRAAARRTEALSLKLAGISTEAIADRMGISVSGVRDLVNRTLERAENRAVEEMRDLENARLDRAQAAIWSKVLEGDIRAIDSFLRLSQRRARLNGLDAPTSLNLNVNVRQEMEQALAVLEATVLQGEVIRDGDPALGDGRDP